MKPFWHPVSALLLTDPPSYATAGMIRIFLRGSEGLELQYAGDRLWPSVRQGQRLIVRSASKSAPEPGSVVVASLDGIPDLLRVQRVSGGRLTLTADADPDLRVEMASTELLAVTELQPRRTSIFGARLRRLFLDHAEAWSSSPDDLPAATVLSKYDGQAPYYAASGATLPPSLLQRIRRNVRSGAHILVAGSGVGMECFALAEEGWQVTGVDFAPRMVELAQQASERRHLPVRFLQEDLLEHQEPVGSLGAVLFTADVYSFLARRDERCRLLQSMSRWLEPNGCILLSARRTSRPYERWILTLQYLRRGGRRWGHTHTRWVSSDGALHRSFVQVHRESALAREARRAGLKMGSWEAGHAMLTRK